MPLLSGPSFPPQAGGPPRQLVVLLHGVGADGQDLIGLAPALARHLPHAAFAAPDAPFPCDLAPYGRQWFSLQDRRPAALLPGLDAAAPLLDAFLDDQLAAHGLEARRLALVGFSQGAMLALHAAPRRAPAVAAVVGYSGALVGGERLADEARSRPPTMLVHGTADEVVPFAALGMAAAALEAAGFPVRSLPLAGLGHGIDPEGIEAGGSFLRAAMEA
jgi:phospholipase/carboxylesterase